MTQTSFSRGSAWSSSLLYDGWGDVTDEQAQDLGSLVVARFQELCAEAGDPTIWWCPETSEVHGECYGETTDEHHCTTPTHHIDAGLDDLRHQARDEVWDAVCGNRTPMSDRVAAVFGL